MAKTGEWVPGREPGAGSVAGGGLGSSPGPSAKERRAQTERTLVTLDHLRSDIMRRSWTLLSRTPDAAGS